MKERKIDFASCFKELDLFDRYPEKKNASFCKFDWNRNVFSYCHKIFSETPPACNEVAIVSVFPSVNSRVNSSRDDARSLSSRLHASLSSCFVSLFTAEAFMES